MWYYSCLSQQEKWAAPSDEGSKLIASLSVKKSSDGIIATANMRPKEVIPPRRMYSHAHSLAVSHLAPIHYWLNSAPGWHQGCSHFQDSSMPLFWNTLPLAAIFSLSTLMLVWSLETWLPIFTLFLKHATFLTYENTLEKETTVDVLHGLKCSEVCVRSVTHPHGQLVTHTHTRPKQIKLLHSIYTSLVL